MIPPQFPDVTFRLKKAANMDRHKPATVVDARQEARQTDGAQSPAGDDVVQQAIGSQLRAVYDEVVRLPVPDRFLSLLSSLDGRPTLPASGKEQES